MTYIPVGEGKDGLRIVTTLKRVVRLVLALGVGLITVLGTMAAGCDDVDGVSLWERCDSWLGNPTLDWPGGNWGHLSFPLLLGIGVGILVWWLLGLTPLGTRRPQ